LHNRISGEYSQPVVPQSFFFTPLEKIHPGQIERIAGWKESSMGTDTLSSVLSADYFEKYYI